MGCPKILQRKLEKKLSKLSKKNPSLLRVILRKMDEIVENPHRYKPLRNDLKGLFRVHINSSFVLIFEIMSDVVIFIDFDHHDNIYG